MWWPPMKVNCLRFVSSVYNEVRMYEQKLFVNLCIHPLTLYRHPIDVCKALFQLKNSLTDIYGVSVTV